MKARGSRRRWAIPVGVGALLAVLALPASASGATAAVAGGTLTFTAATGETNNVAIEPDGAVIRVIDSAAPVTAGGGCMQRSVHRVNCASAGVSLLRVRAFDGDDRAQTLGTTDAELNGGRGADLLTSSDGDDTLNAGKNGFGFPNEFLRAGDGADTLNGSLGPSGGTFMDGGPGDDELLGGPAFDNMVGNLGADVMRGGPGFDSVFWNALSGINVTIGSGANDGEPGEGDDVAGDVETINGTPFNDVLIGNGRENSLFGSGGQDTLEGRDGDDFLDGGDAADTLLAGDDQDQLEGGPKADDFSGGLGKDEASYGDHFNGSATVRIDNVANDGGNGGMEGDNVRTDIEVLTGTNFNDTLIGSGQDNEIFGRQGDDEVTGEGGDDELFGEEGFGSGGGAGEDDLGGGPGDDTLFGGDGPDVHNGGPGFDFADYSRISTFTDLTITINNVANDGAAGEGDNVRDTVEAVIGATGNDTITGSSAPNVLFGGAGADNLNGANGNDLLDGETPGGFSGSFDPDVLDGDNGNDTASYRSHNFAPVVVDIGGGANDGTFGGTEGDDVQSTIENLAGTDSFDELTGNGAANALLGLGGPDTLNGGDGGDELDGGDSVDTANGEGGNDEINSRGDGFTDTDNCGPGGDTAIVDPFDIRNGCEDVIL